MSVGRRLGLLCVAAAAALAPAAAAAQAATGARLIVAGQTGLSAAERHAVRTAAGTRLVRTLPMPGMEVVEVDARRRRAALETLNRDPRVRYAEPDLPVRAFAPDYSGALWGLQRIAVPAAWGISRGAGVVVAVVDTGVNHSHEDLVGRIATGVDFVGPEPPEDPNGHGSHVSATIVGDDDGQGVVGVAPDAQVMPLRVLAASGGAALSTVAAAFDHAGRQGLRIVSASLGGEGTSQAIEDTMRAHPSTLYIAAAGNGGPDGIGDDNDRIPTYPCASAAPNVICVGASDQADARAGFSNVGLRTVDVFAPGEDILSAWVPGPSAFFDLAILDGADSAADGTSFAVPHVSGVAALLLARSPTLSAIDLKNRILAGVDRPPALAGTSLTGGRLNAMGALTATVADADADGIGDVWDDCPAAPDPAQADSDGDLIGDGCDDSDGDTVADLRDRCPSVPASNSADGCADSVDSDGDGLFDRLDRCPSLPAPAARDGCPVAADRDADGVPDARDRCPRERGRRPSGCARARVRALSARLGRCARDRRCVRVSLRLTRRATVALTVQRRRCRDGRCTWRPHLSRTVTTRGRSLTVGLPERARRRLTVGRYRVRVRTATEAGRSRPRFTRVRGSLSRPAPAARPASR